MKWALRILGVIVLIVAVAFAIFRTPDTDAQAMRAKYGSEPSQFVEIDGGTVIHLRDEGPEDGDAQGLPIILLHGSNADLHTWEPWAKELAKTRRVIRFDQVSHGLTGPDPDGDYSRENFTSDVIEVADALGVERFILGGNSMGGKHALGVASLYPSRVAGLILVDGSGAPQDEVEAMMDPAKVEEDDGGNIGFAIARMPGVNLLAQHITPRSLIKQSLEQSVSNQAVVTQEAVDRYWELLRYPGNRAATMERFATEYEPLTKDQIAAIAVPTLILWGEEDRLIPVEAGEWLNQAMPNSELVIYPAIGHLPHEEAVDATLSDVQRWLDSMEKPAS
ncbi:alpha/beta hydrolase [Erythrobacter sp. SCSIO 43205]|uniref:alpha/beta fold hydrolase n=1 Tax=Erythrobacter sp. SCSIO 43205 TaxID=2779361 RepID=UPI001CA84217|nr:alpha/beta hydrolase [Erythrobacter sp. SCSIO 43205]UAB79441.1 alpha/beta hydrolase [Erythrobacter sp. SCSIO 43205]